MVVDLQSDLQGRDSREAEYIDWKNLKLDMMEGRDKGEHGANPGSCQSLSHTRLAPVQ